MRRLPHTRRRILLGGLALLSLGSLLAWKTLPFGAQPFSTAPGPLSAAMAAAIREVTGRDTQLSTTGGTSDGRFIATICRQVIEFGPPNASVHKIDEHIAVADLEPLKDIYRGALERLLT